MIIHKWIWYKSKIDYFHQKEGGYRLKVFDTTEPITYKICDVLIASSSAPTYFTTPAKVEEMDGTEIDYVDGGVGGNCPLLQAVPRMQRIYRNKVKFNSALSIAPPRSNSESLHKYDLCSPWSIKV